MNHKLNSTVIALLMCSLYFPCWAQALEPAPNQRKPIVFRIERPDGHLSLTIKPNPVPGKDVFWGLAELLKSRGADYPVMVLLDSKAELADLIQDGIASKVGFTNIREFVVYRDRGIMAELTFGRGVAITDYPIWSSAN
jgi:hypothetical protein